MEEASKTSQELLTLKKLSDTLENKLERAKFIILTNNG